jgi:hypothetical protein
VAVLAPSAKARSDARLLKASEYWPEIYRLIVAKNPSPVITALILAALVVVENRLRCRFTHL